MSHYYSLRAPPHTIVVLHPGPAPCCWNADMRCPQRQRPRLWELRREEADLCLFCCGYIYILYIFIIIYLYTLYIYIIIYIYIYILYIYYIIYIYTHYIINRLYIYIVLIHSMANLRYLPKNLIFLFWWWQILPIARSNRLYPRFTKNKSPSFVGKYTTTSRVADGISPLWLWHSQFAMVFRWP